MKLTGDISVAPDDDLIRFWRLKVKGQGHSRPSRRRRSPRPVVSLLPPGLPSRTIAWTVSSELLGFYNFFRYFFVFLPCARLSCPSHQLLAAG